MARGVGAGCSARKKTDDDAAMDAGEPSLRNHELSRDDEPASAAVAII
jgi:hypothetical protein